MLELGHYATYFECMIYRLIQPFMEILLEFSLPHIQVRVSGSFRFEIIFGNNFDGGG